MDILSAIGIDYYVLPIEPELMRGTIEKARRQIEKQEKPVALIIRKKTFSKFITKEKTSESMSREEAIKIIVDNLDGEE